MADNPRIDELRRRVQKDPASIAFAQLAEEYRRAGSHEDAIATCRAGLTIHPGYLSARVTLGRALIEVNDLDAAQAELEYVLQERDRESGGDSRRRRRFTIAAGSSARRSVLQDRARPGEARSGSGTDGRRNFARDLPGAGRSTDDGLSFEQASAEFLAALEDLPGGLDAALAPPEPMGLPRLERFLDAIHTYRQKKAV